MKVTYTSWNVVFNAKYYCDCGNKFYRKNIDHYTLNPYNKYKTHKENSDVLLPSLKVLKRKCPKCGAICKPEKVQE